MTIDKDAGFYILLFLLVFQRYSCLDYAGLQQSEFSFIKNYISERETKYLTSMKIQTDPRDETHEEFVVGIRFRFYRQNVNARDIFSLALPGVDFELVLRGSTALDETQVDSLFEEDLKSYIEETRNLVDNFDSYSVEMKTAFVDSHFLMYATQTFWNDINDADKNLAQVCVNHYTHDSVFAKASSDELKVRLQGDCGLIMDYARSIDDSISTYDPCYNDLLFPYGPEFGDNVNEKNDDGGSGEYFVSIPFPFFDENHDSLWVNTNGVISFLTEVMTFTPDAFPLDDNRRLVAPFWADVDTRDGGDVYFREVIDPNDHLLKQTKELIVQQFADHQNFEVTWLFIATWDDVAFFGSSAIGNLKRNTFQCVLATNGRHSFAVYHYGNVTWTTGTASQGDADTGLGGIPAQVGFNAGDGINFVLVNGSRTHEVVNIDTSSNVDEAGRFLFQIDNKQMAPGGCNTEGVLSVYPSFGYMLGGQRIYVSGPCFDNTVEISCKFGDNVVRATMESAVVATCTTPIFYEVGRIEFRLSADGGVSFDKYRGIFTVVSEEYRTSIVKRVDSANWHTLNDLTIEWDTSEFLTSRLHVSLYGYVEDVSAGLKFITHLSPDTIDNSGRYTFTRQPDNGASFHAGVIRLSDHEVNFDDHPQSLWSDIHPLKWKYNVDSYTFCKDTLYSDFERNLEFLDDLEPCPCTLQQARLDTGRYTAHPRCNEAWSHNDDNCHRKPLAHHCVRVNEPSAKGAGQQCCYDDNGNLLNGANQNSGGTAHRRHHGGIHPYKEPGKVPYLSHYLTDILLWEHCCIFDSEQTLCADYYDLRPSDNCSGYLPPQPGGGIGDPHINTFDGSQYTFNGVGEYWLVTTTDDRFTMQGRMEQLEMNTGETVTGGTVFTALAMKGHGTDTVQIQVSERRILDAWVKCIDLDDNWQGVDFDQTDRWGFNGLSVVREIQGNTAVITVSFSLGISVQVTATEGTLMMSYVFFAPPSMKGTTLGLMGTWNDNQDNHLLTPEGITISPSTTLQEIHYSFGMKWNVTEEESLFRYDIGQSHASLNDYNYVPTFEITPNDEAITVCGDDKLCLFDYQVTGSENFARQTKQAVEKHRSIIEDTAAVVSCGFLEAPANGSTAVEKITEGGTACYYCNEGFTLVGSDIRTCLRNGSWTGHQPRCEVIDCGPPEEIDHANIYLTCTVYNCTVEYKCLSGYASKGSKVRTCQGDGEWSEEEPSCTKDTWFVWLIVSVALVTVVAIAFVLYCVQRYHAKKSKANKKPKNSVSPVNTQGTSVKKLEVEDLD